VQQLALPGENGVVGKVIDNDLDGEHENAFKTTAIDV
jgi:hypothetical protein